MTLGLLTAIALAGIGAVVLAYAVVVAPRRLRLAHVEVPIAGLSRALDGYTLAVLADPHYGGTLGAARHMERAVQMAHAADPDLIVLLGDYALSHYRLPRLSRRMYEWALPALTPLLRALRARDGVVAVLGNHDHEYDARAVAAWLTSVGARVLVNQCVCIERDGSRLAIGGVDDAKYGTVDPHGGCAGVPADVPRVIISHNPDGVLALAPDARADLVLSGHTHGGQVVLPLYGAPFRHCRICRRDCARGWVRGARVPLYVSAGVGAAVPLRVNCPPEVVVVRLRSAPGRS